MNFRGLAVDHYQIIARRFQRTMEDIAMSVDAVADPIAQGSELMSQVLLQEGRIFCCGCGPDAALCQLFTTSLLDKLEQDRPALPAINLCANSNGLDDLAGTQEIFARPLRALGQEGDLLLVLHSGGDSHALAAAVNAARERDMLVVAVTDMTDGALSASLRAGDAHIAVSAHNRPALVELHTMIVHLLAQLIEYTLFGNHEEN